MSEARTPYDDDYVEFVRLFNEGRYDESHEALLGLWQRNIGNTFYKGLIQLAGAYQHWASGNAFWAEDLFASAHNLLEEYAPRYQGIDVEALLATIRACNEVARRAQDGAPGEAGEEMPVVQIQLE